MHRIVPPWPWLCPWLGRAMIVRPPPLSSQHARDIDRQAEGGDRDGLVEVDRDRPEEALDRLVADEEAIIARMIALVKPARSPSLPVPKLKRSSSAWRARVTVSERREQQRARMRRHMQAVGNERDRAEKQAADDLRDHHDAAERDHHPGAAFVALVALAEKDVAMRVGVAVGQRCRACLLSYKCSRLHLR